MRDHQSLTASLPAASSQDPNGNEQEACIMTMLAIIKAFGWLFKQNGPEINPEVSQASFFVWQ